MKLLSTDYKHGIISLKIDDIGDLWHLTCILSKGDIVSAKTLRRIKSSTDSEKAERGPKKPMYLTIQIEKIDFHEHRNAIKLTGPIISGPNTIQLGTYHSLFISDNTTVTIKKDVWNK
jgi:protein pelota